MPLPNDRSRLAKALAQATGHSLVWVYRCLKDGRKPYGKKAARAWDRVVAREPSVHVVAGVGAHGSCSQVNGRGAA